MHFALPYGQKPMGAREWNVEVYMKMATTGSCLNTWPPVVGTVWEGLQGAALEAVGVKDFTKFFLCLLLADQDVSDQFSVIMDPNLLERQAQLNAFMPWCFVTIEE